MKTTPRKIVDRYGRILRELQARIVSGQDPAGSRIPSRRELAERYGTTLATVQKALLRLEQWGFMESRAWEGSFVATHPPHLYRYGMLLPELPTGPEGWHWSKFWSTLNQVAGESARWAPRTIVSYCGLGNWSESEDAHKLVADLTNGCLAGLLVVGPSLLSGSPVEELLKKHPLPVVSFSGASAGPGIPRVIPDPEASMQALAHLRQRGCRRVAVVGYQYDLATKEGRTLWQQLLEQAGFPLWPGAVMGLDPHYPAPAETWTRLLFMLPPELRPDGVLVKDDNFVEAVVQGLREAGVVIGQDVKVLANCNYPLRTPLPAGVDRIGCDQVEALNAGLELLERQRQGKTVPAVYTVKSRLEAQT